MNEEDLTPQLEKKYVEIQYDALSQRYLREFCKDNGFDLSIKFNGEYQDPVEFDFHSTVWFTTSEHTGRNASFDIAMQDFEAVQFSLFGEEENILVLEISSDDLVATREMFGEKLGMQDEWPDYKPHITLSYSFTGDLPDIPLPDLSPLVADKLNVKSQG